MSQRAPCKVTAWLNADQFGGPLGHYHHRHERSVCSMRDRQRFALSVHGQALSQNQESAVAVIGRISHFCPWDTDMLTNMIPDQMSVLFMAAIFKIEIFIRENTDKLVSNIGPELCL